MMRNCSHPKLMPSTHAKKDTAARPRSLTSIPKTTSGASEKAPPFLPKVFMANTCSVLNKVDELAELIDKDQADIAVITESWIKPTTAPEEYNIDGFNAFSKCRPVQIHGGILVYVRDSLQVEELREIIVPSELEVMWLLVSHPNFPRAAQYLVVGAVYIIPESPHQELLVSHLTTAIDYIKTSKSQAGIMILCDFNRTNIRPLCLGSCLTQVVNKPTRGDAILDLIITNLNDLYYTPNVTSPIGRSYHSCVSWFPKSSRPINMKVKRNIQ